MIDTLTDRIKAHLAKARAAKEDAPVTVWWAKGPLMICSGAGNVFDTYTPQRAIHIAANDPATIEAFCAVAKADDTEPCRVCAANYDPADPDDCPGHRTCCYLYNEWQQRQELKAALYDALR